MKRVTLIVAHGPDGVVGNNGGLPWPHHAEDMRRFREATIGEAVIMGRKTWESLGKKLPNRQNIVVTSKPKSIDPHQADVAATIHEALEIADGLHPFIIGGGQIFMASLSLVNHFLITEMQKNYPGDVYFKVPFLSDKRLIKEEHWENDNPDQACIFKEYENID